MIRAMLLANLPWMATLVVAVVALRFLLALSHARLNLAALRSLHRDEAGAVQSLSFVLTLPVFVMILMLIVQVSQIMIGTVVVHYAAFAAARSASVWIPANMGTLDETENRISALALDPAAPIDGDGTRYAILPGSPKYKKIEMAAALACLSIAPSRDVGAILPPDAGATADALVRAYQALVPDSVNNARIPTRLRNKLAYSLANTRIVVNFLHKETEPPLARYDIPPDRNEFYPNEVGWQDPVRVEVTHDMALLPGPGRLLARRVPSPYLGVDYTAASIDERGSVYVRSLTASATLGIEGEKPVLRYVQAEGGPGSGECECDDDEEDDDGPSAAAGSETTQPTQSTIQADELQLDLGPAKKETKETTE